MDVGAQLGTQPTGCDPLTLGLPNNPQSIGRDPLILFSDQALFTTNRKQLVKPIASLGELAGFEIQHGFELSLALHPLLIRHRQTHQAHPGDHNEADLESQTEHTANQLLALRRKAEKLAIGTEYSVPRGDDCRLEWRRRLSPRSRSPGGLGHAENERSLQAF